MTTKTIQIDGMKGDACVKEVTTALRDLNGVEAKSVAVGSAVLECKDDAACDAACGAINAAGYTARQPNQQPGSQGKGGVGHERGTHSRDAGNAAHEGGSKPDGVAAGETRAPVIPTSGSKPGDAKASGAQRPDTTRGGSPTSAPRGTDSPATSGKSTGR
jgi:copper chaperone CopZ